MSLCFLIQFVLLKNCGNLVNIYIIKWMETNLNMLHETSLFIYRNMLLIYVN